MKEVRTGVSRNNPTEGSEGEASLRSYHPDERNHMDAQVEAIRERWKNWPRGDWQTEVAAADVAYLLTQLDECRDEKGEGHGPG